MALATCLQDLCDYGMLSVVCCTVDAGGPLVRGDIEVSDLNLLV